MEKYKTSSTVLKGLQKLLIYLNEIIELYCELTEDKSQMDPSS